MVDAFTISSNNYLGMTNVFVESYLRYHPGSKVYVCLVDRPHSRVDYGAYDFEIIPAEDLEIPVFFNFAFKYDILELNTAVKPFVFKYLRDRKKLDRAFYFDPDILVHDRLPGLEEALDSHQAVLTPHLTQALDNICRPPERVIGMCGIYNLGFAGLRLDEGTQTFLDWWCDRLYRYCINDLTNGMFVDQSWMDFAPAYLDSVAIMREPIYNIAYWNLPHRHPKKVGDHWEVEGRRVGFFHFSGVDPLDLDAVSKHQDRFDLSDRPELRGLFEHYSELVESSGHHRMRDIPYCYHHFRATDIPIPRPARVALMETDPEGMRWPDPFDTKLEDSYLSWLTEPILLEGGLIHRMALFLWRDRADLHSAFPGVENGDIEAFRSWYLEGGAAEAGLHSCFIEGLEAASRTPAEQVAVDEIGRFRSIDLSKPGSDDLSWLNQRQELPGELGSPLNRFARLVYRDRPDLRELYPQLDGEGRRGLMYWLCVFGPEVLGVDRRLLGPLWSQLSLKTQLKLWLKGKGHRPCEFSGLAEAGSGSGGESKPELLSPSALENCGVNLVGYFEGEGVWQRFARKVATTVRATGRPLLEISLDHDLPDLMTSFLIRYPRGVPYPVTVLCCAPGDWKRVHRLLPPGSRVGGRIVGCSGKLARDIPEEEQRSVDELWFVDENHAADGVVEGVRVRFLSRMIEE